MTRARIRPIAGAVARGAIGLALVSLLSPVRAIAQVRDVAVPAAARAATISGMVVRADDERLPIRSAQVAVIGVASGTTRVTTTSDEGRFSFTGLPPDRYNVGASKAPYLTAMAGAKRPARPGSAVVLAAGQTITGVTIKMFPGAAITGVIRDPSGEPSQRTTVALMRWRIRNGERVLGTPLVTDTVDTDDRGRYRFFGLAPGEYVVVAMRSGAAAPHVLSQFDVDTVLSSKTVGMRPIAEEHVPVYYPGVTRPADAGIVAVSVGEEKSTVDFQLEFAKPARLRIALSSIDGSAPVAGSVSIATASADAPAQAVYGGGSSQPKTEFDFPSLKPDTYLVTAIGVGRLGTKVVEVGSGSDQTISLVLRPPATIAGRVVLEGTGSVRPPTDGFRVGFRGLTGIPQGQQQPMPMPANDQGTFVFTGVVGGRYVISGAGPGDWALQSVVVDGRDVTDRVIDVDADAPPKQVVITYTDRWQEISGRLQLANGAPVNDYTVVVIPADPALWPFGMRRILTARPGTNGEFVLGGRGASTLPAGDYLLAAVTDIESDDLADPAYLAALAPAAIPVALKPGERRVQSLAVR